MNDADEHYDLIIVLGSQIGISEQDKMVLAFHTEMKARAAGIVWQELNTDIFILTGGYNIGVRYELFLNIPVFGTASSDKKPDFSDAAKQRARYYRSEASVMAELMKKEYGVRPQALILEEESATTQQNAEFCAEILEDLFWHKAGGKKTRVGIIALLYHIERALAEFNKAFREKKVAVTEPLFAENILAAHDSDWVYRICQYYSVSKGGKQWDVEKIRELLIARKSLSVLLQRS